MRRSSDYEKARGFGESLFTTDPLKAHPPPKSLFVFVNLLLLLLLLVIVVKKNPMRPCMRRVREVHL